MSNSYSYFIIIFIILSFNNNIWSFIKLHRQVTYEVICAFHFRIFSTSAWFFSNSIAIDHIKLFSQSYTNGTKLFRQIVLFFSYVFVCIPIKKYAKLDLLWGPSGWSSAAISGQRWLTIQLIFKRRNKYYQRNMCFAACHYHFIVTVHVYLMHKRCH